MRGFLLGAAFVVSWLGLQQVASAAAPALQQRQQQQQQEEEVLVCEGHVTASQEHAAALGSIDLTAASVTLIAEGGVVRETQFCFSSGYYLLPVDEETAGRPFTLRVEGPPEWIFETQERHLPGGKCQRDIDFKVIGFAVAGEVVSYATGEGVEGVPLLLQPTEAAAGATAAAGPAAAAEAAAAVRGVTKRDGSFALASSGPGVSSITLEAPQHEAPPAWALSPQQHTVQVDAAGRVSPPRVTFKLVAAQLQAKGPAGLGATVAAVLLLPPECPAAASANCGAPPLSAAAAGAVLPPAALAAAAPAEAKPLLGRGSEVRLCATAIDEETGSFVFPLAPLCSSWLMLSPFALHKQQQQQQQQETALSLSYSPQAQLVKVSKGSLRAVDFKLAGAAVRGRVVLQKGDSFLGVSGAKLWVNGEDSGVQTAQDGTFLLPSVQAKPLTLEAEKEGMRFEPLRLEKLPLPWALQPTVRASGVSVCGLLPAGVEAQVQLADGPQRLFADRNGRVCFYAAPHSEVSVQLTGGGFPPSVRALRVGGEPLPNVQLMHATYTLRGIINCSSGTTGTKGSKNSSKNSGALAAGCSPQRLLLRVWASDAAPQDVPLQVLQQQQKQQQKHELRLGFSLEGLSEGSYRLELTEKAGGGETASMCWRNQSITVSLPYRAGEDGVEGETSDGGASVSFVAAGFQVRGRSSDPMFVSLSPAQKSEDTAGTAADQRSLSYLLPRGPFALCVPCLSCTYTVKPASWLRVEVKPSVLSAAAGSTAELLTRLEARRVVATVSVALPRWASAAAAAAAAALSQDTAKGVSLLPPQPFEFHAPQQHQQQQQQQQREGMSPLLLPGGDTEPEGPTVQLVVHAGCRLEGQISPAVEGVRIEFYRRDTETVLAACVSEAGGRCFSVLDCSLLPQTRQHLAARAEQQGFDFREETPQLAADKAAADAATGTARFFLKATKHSSVSVVVTEETTGSPLAGVLLSLFETGALQREKAHRQRKVTKETGAASFSFLPSGEFSLKPILKSYAFSPPLQQLQVTEGQELSVHLEARRVAFDCKGLLRVIGDTESTLQHTVQEAFIVYAVASDGSRVEASVGPLGAFQLKALRPGIEYEVGVTAPQGLEVEAIEPALRRILMPAEDLTGTPGALRLVAFIAFLPPPTSVMLSADVRETFGVGEPEDHDESLLVLFLPLKGSATPSQSPSNSQAQQQQQLAEEAAATAAGPAAEEDTAADAPLDLPQGTVAAKLPATGVLLLSGVAAGSYKVVLIKSRSPQGSTVPLRSGSKLLLASELPVLLSPHATLRVSLPRLSRSMVADPTSLGPSGPLPAPKEAGEEGGVLTGLVVLAVIVCFSADSTIRKVLPLPPPVGLRLLQRSTGSPRIVLDSVSPKAAAATAPATAPIGPVAVDVLLLRPQGSAALPFSRGE
ncbi:hypothetical protein Esti_004626 [Eimeria stiedai]